MARRRVAVLLATTLVSLTAGCGARWTDGQRAEIAGRHTDVVVAGSNTGTASATGSAVPASGTATAAQTAAGGPAGASGGSGATVVGGSTFAAGPAAGETTGGAAPCSAPSDAPGVTDTEITLATISTQTGPVPGLGSSSLAAAQAYIEYRNSTGGVCGRQLTLLTADDGFDISRNRALVEELDGQALAFAGGLPTGDAGGADVVEARQIPYVSTAVASSMESVSTMFDVVPPFADPNQPTAKYQYLYAQGVRRASVVLLAADQTRSQAQMNISQIEASGIEVVQVLELPLTTLSHDSAARSVANSGADYMLFVGDATQSASMARSLDDTGYQLLYEDYLAAYGDTFIELTGAAGEGATAWIRSLPNDDAATNPELATFLEWMAQTAPDASPDTFAADSWAATKAVVDALAALPGPITRDALLAQLRSMHSYDAGGLFGNIDLGSKLSNGCVILMVVRDGAWRRVTPDQGFLC